MPRRKAPLSPAIIDPPPKPKLMRGFACMDPAKRAEIAKKGGASVKPENRSFSRDKGLAITAGRKGGSSSRGGGRKALAYADATARRAAQKVAELEE